MVVPVGPVGGRLLLATPPLVDPNFDRTVVYVVEHHDEGALGIVLNRPTDEPVAGELAAWGGLLGPHAVVFDGGPVEPDGLVGLATMTPSAVDGAAGAAIAAIDLAADPSSLAATARSVRIFRGYAGWGPGQLDQELGVGAWIVVDAEPDDVGGAEPTTLWRSVLRRQSGRLAWLADAPDDLDLN